MAAVLNPRLVLSSRPTGYPIAGKDITYDTTRTIDPTTVELNGGFLTKTLWLSLDPYLRGRMDDPKLKTYYAPQWALGDTLDNTGIAVVVRSDVPALPAGAHVMGFLPFEAYTLHPASSADGFQVIENKEGVPLSTYLGVLGMPGETGWYGLEEYGECKPGESIYVSTGAGQVGSVVCQLAKAKGLRVIASTGSAEKVAFLESLGVDRAFNYKTSSVAEELKEFGGIDIYWDNVGGQMLETAIENMKPFGRLILCGIGSEYNTEEKYGVKNLDRVVYWRLKMVGFVVPELRPKYADAFYATAPGMVARGELKYSEEVVEGLERVGDAFAGMLQGRNLGKVVVRVAQP
ncbi:alcohol dehydrogenase [Calocera cornea HHB12733]|uniref:Alcohol dehydrogenase n=1 Tax=Calocera cornea HHB12733 TaxID=1353952 RepID=A0A165HG10_9BASI|nr:alcohol dehydrogenase [Calocera cornea HHB12733]